jgi:hypothetical protein
MPPVIYWVKFDKDPQPERIRVNTMKDLFAELEYRVLRCGDVWEWMVRDYK